MYETTHSEIRKQHQKNYNTFSANTTNSSMINHSTLNLSMIKLSTFHRRLEYGIRKITDSCKSVKRTVLIAVFLIVMISTIQMIFLGGFLSKYDLFRTYSIQKKPAKPKYKKTVIIPPRQNRPFRQEYVMASKSFENGIVPPALTDWTPSNDSYKYFQPVDERDSWIYSAFYVDATTTNSSKATIVGMGFARLPIGRAVHCVLQMDNKGKVLKRARGRTVILPDHHKTSVRPMRFECYTPEELRPVKVSFSLFWSHTPTNSFVLQYPKPATYNFTVCYSPLHSNYSNINELIWSLEMNRILGADHIYVYNFSIAETTSKVLKHYHELGLMTILQWPIPTIESWYLAQMLALNDCLYRNRNMSKYVVFADTDELVMPQLHATWLDMINAIDGNTTAVEGISPSLQNMTITNSANTSTRKVKKNSVQEYIITAAAVPKENNSHLENKFDKLNDPLSNQVSKSGNSVLNNENKTRNFNVSKLNPSIDQAMDITKINPLKPSLSPDENNLLAKPSNIERGQSATSSHNLLQPTTTTTSSTPVASFSLRCAFFNWKNISYWRKVKKEYSISDTDEQFIRKNKVTPLLQDIRLDDPFPHNMRSKVIVRPELVNVIGIHFPHSYYKNARPVYVEPSFAMLHHYRLYQPDQSNTRSSTIYRFVKPLLNNLRKRYDALEFDSRLIIT